MASIASLQSERVAAPSSHFNKGDTVHIKPFNGIPPRRHAGEFGIVRRVLPLFDFVEHERSYDYWVEIGADAWLYSESALEVASGV